MTGPTNKTRCYLNYLFVKNEHRKTGLGRRLLNEFEVAAQRKVFNTKRAASGEPFAVLTWHLVRFN
ncbi:GNAT family N-acetyltransferase [Paenibacillus sp. S3N08]|uniref:GNAT family N-acetyltransferase n=1 Tax=Paenibacillus agricola TaxID=2716264 RepID=A0ABX0JEW1_9BACL|nr:GNAT family N-acetyltransferase [Paenibacillus agricola]